MLLAILICCVASTLAQPLPCETPKQFEGRIYQSDSSEGFTGFVRLSYDETNQRVRELQEVEVNKTDNRYEILRLFNEKKEYRVNLRDRKCNVTTLTRAWRPAGVPSNATYMGEGIVGPVNIPTEHIDVVTFQGKTEDGSEYRSVVTQPDCLPVSVDFYNKEYGFFHETFYGITLGIHDSSVFTVPSTCH